MRRPWPWPHFQRWAARRRVRAATPFTHFRRTEHLRPAVPARSRCWWWRAAAAVLAVAVVPVALSIALHPLSQRAPHTPFKLAMVAAEVSLLLLRAAMDQTQASTVLLHLVAAAAARRKVPGARVDQVVVLVKIRQLHLVRRFKGLLERLGQVQQAQRVPEVAVVQARQEFVVSSLQNFPAVRERQVVTVAREVRIQLVVRLLITVVAVVAAQTTTQVQLLNTAMVDLAVVVMAQIQTLETEQLGNQTPAAVAEEETGKQVAQPAGLEL